MGLIYVGTDPSLLSTLSSVVAEHLWSQNEAHLRGIWSLSSPLALQKGPRS